MADPKTRITTNAQINARIKTRKNTNMKATMNRQVYDTDKATLVAEDGNNRGRNDFRGWNEQLYVTAKGNWFLHGWGGSLTDYAEYEGNSVSGGERIVLMTRAQALTWCEDHKAQDAIDQNFTDMISEA